MEKTNITCITPRLIRFTGIYTSFEFLFDNNEFTLSSRRDILQLHKEDVEDLIIFLNSVKDKIPSKL
jgi:hypothetical protein